MLRGSGRPSSVIQAAGSPGAGASALPNALVVLVKTKRGTPAATASSSSTSVPSMLVCTKSSRRWDPTCGLCSVAAWSTASTPSMQRRTQPRSATEPTTVVYGDARTSSPMACTPSSPRLRIRASPRWPELPVTRTRMPTMYQPRVNLDTSVPVLGGSAHPHGRKHMTSSGVLRVVTAWMTATLASAAFASAATAATYTVSDPGDSGAGTLRQAILDANGDGVASDIDFSLGGMTISPTTALPAISQAVTIDSTADAGNVLDGSSAGLAANGFTISAGNVTIKGLEIDDFTGAGIQIAGSNNTIGENQIGVGGGTGAAGISITSGTGNAIGGSAGANTIYGNTGAGIAIASNSNIVTGNTIGDFGSPNGGDGVAISGTAASNQVGGVTVGDENQIVGNGAAGVSVTGSGTGNAIVGNGTAENTDLGIDLGTAGVTANDANDVDTGANNLQNFPVLSTFTTTAGNSTITGTLNSTASTSFRIDFYSASSCDDSGNGEGDTHVGSAIVTTNGSGNATINSVFPQIPDHFVTATATGPGTTGAGSTSEFSACQAGPPTGAIVTNGTVMLGVNNTGELNYSCTNTETNCPGPSAAGAGPVGLRLQPANLDSTSP